MTIERIQLGYWYPLTTLHLAEIQDFFAARATPLHLEPSKLVAYRSKLGILTSELHLGELEMLEMHAKSDLRVRIFEDGLVTVSDNHTQLKRDIKELTTYFEKAYQPAMRYLFSVGAPTPKELAGIDHETPIFIVTRQATRRHALAILKELGVKLEFELDTKDMELYRGGEYFIVNAKPHFKGVEELIETWIYFKEFKSQLHHYMNLHRSVWTQIEAIKQERWISGWQVKTQRTKLESYRKTIELIEARINQMDLYIASRNHVATSRGWDAYLSDVLQFRYTNLEHTHDYVKSLWGMTRQHVESAISLLSEINAQSTKTSVQTLTAISSLGVISMMINFLTFTAYPKFNSIGLHYFLILISTAALLNALVVVVYRTMRYRVNATALSKDLHKYAKKRR